MTFFDTFLRSVIPFDAGWKVEIEPCVTLFEEDDTGPCFRPPTPLRHLSDRDWHSTLLLLFFCFYIQIIVMLIACAWDFCKEWVLKLLKITKREIEFTNPLFHVVVDSLDVFLSITVCITFVVRAYGWAADDETPFDPTVVNAVDLTGACYFCFVYLYQWIQAETLKITYAMSSTAVLNLLTIASSLSVQSQADGWLPFTFLRSICMTAACHRLMKITDLPELYEQLFLSASDFFSMVFSFGGVIYMLENLGNPAGWADGNENFTFFKAIWFVMVTVSTVGYGDVYPISILGQISGMCFIVGGVVFFGSRTSRIATLLNDAASGLGRFSAGRHRKHIIVSGEVNEVSFVDFAVEFYNPEHQHSDKSKLAMCVLSKNIIDLELCNLEDFVRCQVQCLVGSLPRDVDRVKVKDAAACFFLADDHAADLTVQTDREMLLRALKAKNRVKKLTRNNIPTYVGVLHPDSLLSAVGMTALCVSSLKTGLLAKSASCPGIIPLLANLLMSVDKKTKEDARVQAGGLLNDEYVMGLDCEIYKVRMPYTFQGKKYGEVAALLFEHGMSQPKSDLETATMILIGIGYNDKKGGGDDSEPAERIVIFPRKDDTIKEESFGYFIASEAPTERVLNKILQSKSLQEYRKKNQVVPEDADGKQSKKSGPLAATMLENRRRLEEEGAGKTESRVPEHAEEEKRHKFKSLPGKLEPGFEMRMGSMHGAIQQDANYQAHAKRVVLRDHVVVCGLPISVKEFVEALWKTHKMDRKKHEVLFLWDGAMTDDQKLFMKLTPGVWLLEVPPLDPESLKKAAVEDSACVLILTERRGRTWQEPGIIDAGVVFAHRFLTTLEDHHGQETDEQRATLRSLVAKGRVVCEINENANIDLMEQDLEDMAQLNDGTPFLRPMFAAGGVYSSSIVAALMVQAFYNPDILPLFGTLISSRIANTSVSVGGLESDDRREVVLRQLPVPANYCDKEYRELFHDQIENHDQLPLGLYRLNCQVPRKGWKNFWSSPCHPYRGTSRIRKQSPRGRPPRGRRRPTVE